MNTHKEHARIHTYAQTLIHTGIHTSICTRTCMHTHTRTHLVTHLQTTKPRKYSQTRSQSLAHACAHTHTQSSAHIRIMRMDMQWAPLLYTHCSPPRLTRTPSLSSADDPMTRCGALGLRGEVATPMRQGVWRLLPVVLNAVPIHTQCCNHYLRDEASWLMALAISSNKHHTHTHTHTHSHLQSRDTRKPERGAASCQSPQPPPHCSS